MYRMSRPEKEQGPQVSVQEVATSYVCINCEFIMEQSARFKWNGEWHCPVCYSIYLYSLAKWFQV
jgi:succinate dehydrogenase/fumarate reductase-like Fe-S protein